VSPRGERRGPERRATSARPPAPPSAIVKVQTLGCRWRVADGHAPMLGRACRHRRSGRAAVTMAPADAAFRSVYFGFGFEGITSADQRNAVMGRTIDSLLAP